MKSCIGELSLHQQQAERLGVGRYKRLSPLLVNCCLRLSATESYQQAETDLAALTGIQVGHSYLHRLVQQTTVPETSVQSPVHEISLDGGKARLRTPLGQPSEWRDYKAVRLNCTEYGGFFQANADLVTWVNTQPLEDIVVCLGDGHPGIWNLFAGIAREAQRFEILDWYHLKENLFKVEAPHHQLECAETHLWYGRVEAVRTLFAQNSSKSALNFCAYLDGHQHRLVNYHEFQSQQLCSIGSGAVESAVKQIDRRLKLSGAQWKRENVSQMLRLRCAYLNGTLAA